MESKFQLLKARNLSDLISDTFGFTFLNIKPLFKVIVLLVLPILILGGYFFSTYMTSLMSLAGSHDPAGVSALASRGMGTIAAGYIGIIIASICHNLAVMQTFIKYEESESGIVEAKDIFAGIKSNFLRYIGFIFGLGILAFVGMFILLLIVGLLMQALGGRAESILVLIFFIVLCYPLISLCFAPMISIRERRDVISSITHSFYLIKGYWWQTFAVIFLVGIIVYLLSILCAVPFYIIFYAAMFHSTSASGNFTSPSYIALTTTFMLCGATIVSSLLHIAILIQYYSLAERKMGEDLMKKIDFIGVPETPAG